MPAVPSFVLGDPDIEVDATVAIGASPHPLAHVTSRHSVKRLFVNSLKSDDRMQPLASVDVK